MKEFHNNNVIPAKDCIKNESMLKYCGFKCRVNYENNNCNSFSEAFGFAPTDHPMNKTYFYYHLN